MASIQRRSLRLIMKDFRIALADADRFMDVARPIWEQGLEMSPDAHRLEAIANASEARCSPAAKRLLNACAYDQPLPGYLEELRNLGTLSQYDLSFVITEIERLSTAEEWPALGTR